MVTEWVRKEIQHELSCCGHQITLPASWTSWSWTAFPSSILVIFKGKDLKDLFLMKNLCGQWVLTWTEMFAKLHAKGSLTLSMMQQACWSVFSFYFCFSIFKSIPDPQNIEQGSLELFLGITVWVSAYHGSTDKQGQVYFNNLRRGRYLYTTLTHSQSLCILAKKDPFLRKENYFHP